MLNCLLLISLYCIISLRNYFFRLERWKLNWRLSVLIVMLALPTQYLFTFIYFVVEKHGCFFTLHPFILLNIEKALLQYQFTEYYSFSFQTSDILFFLLLLMFQCSYFGIQLYRSVLPIVFFETQISVRCYTPTLSALLASNNANFKKYFSFPCAPWLRNEMTNN